MVVIQNIISAFRIGGADRPRPAGPAADDQADGDMAMLRSLSRKAPDRGAAVAPTLAATGTTMLGRHPQASFRDILPREALEQRLREADVVLVPSRYDSFGLVAIEAMAAERSARAFANADHVAIVIHDHRWRLGLRPPRAAAG